MLAQDSCEQTASYLRPPAEPDSYTLITHNGAVRNVGANVAAFGVLIPSFRWWDRLVRAGAYSVATAFIAGHFDVDGDLIAAIRWWHAHRGVNLSDRLMGVLSRLRLESWFQARARALSNVHFHYDRSNAFYQLFLDRRMEYSCAYFADPGWSLEEAQLAELDHICRKLDLRAGDVRRVDTARPPSGAP